MNAIPPSGSLDGLCAPIADSRAPKESPDVVCDLLHAAQQIRKLLNERLEPHNLNDVRLAVLKMVRDTENRGGCSQAELAAEIAQSESSVSTLIDRMRGDRLLYRLRAPSDRRRRRLVLTEDGRAALESARRDYQILIDSIRRVLEEEKQLALAALLTELSTAIGDTTFLPITEPASASPRDVSPAA
ncbi:MAG: MarR family winged helix-turn-helix transcriptional regulator [Planctomycetaceae bacterium]